LRSMQGEIGRRCARTGMAMSKTDDMNLEVAAKLREMAQKLEAGDAYVHSIDGLIRSVGKPCEVLQQAHVKIEGPNGGFEYVIRFPTPAAPWQEEKA
jgi:hypothetical protein